jgi:hypothetical protein
MARAVKTRTARSLKKGEKALLLPGPTGAEPWEVWILGPARPAECVQTCPTPLDNRLRKTTTLALPVAQVFCLPLWLNATDPKLFPEMIPLQLELRGLQPRGNAPPVFDFSIVAQEASRTLVLVGILPSSLAPEVHAEAYDSFELSARCLPIPENAITLWPEQDRLAVAITRGTHLVYYQILAEGRITQRVLQDINSIRASLVMQGVLNPLQQVMLWCEAGPAERADLQAVLKLPVAQAERPSPRPPATAWKLMPVTVSEAQKSRAIRRWQYRAALGALLIYLLVDAWMASQLFLTSRKVDELRRWNAAHAQDIALVRDTRAAWRELRPVVDEANYPLQLLLHVQESIPADQLNLTYFQSDESHFMVKGEAKNVAAAYQFLDNLKANKNFTGCAWDMPQPTLKANDLASFQINGTLPNPD